MVIYNQDKTGFVIVGFRCGICVDQQYDESIISLYCGASVLKLGTYENRERAKEIISDIAWKYLDGFDNYYMPEA